MNIQQDTPLGQRRSTRWLAAGLLTSLAAYAVEGRADTVWVAASSAEKLSGPLVLGARTGIVEEGALGDFLVSTVCVSAQRLNGGQAEFAVRLPVAGKYYVWARLRRPLPLDASFAFFPAGEQPATDSRWALGLDDADGSGWRWVNRSGLDAVQCDTVTPDIERLIGAAVRWAADSRVPVEVSAEAPIMVTSLDQPPRRVIHLVSLNGDTRYQDDRVATAGRVTVHVEIPPSRAIRRIRRLWAPGEVAAEIQGGRATVVLDEVGLYEVLDVQWR